MSENENGNDKEKELLSIVLERLEHGITLLIEEKHKCAIAHFACLFGRLKNMEEMQKLTQGEGNA